MSLELLRPIQQARVVATDANINMVTTAADISRLLIVGSGWTAGRTITLPTADVKAGDIFEIHNVSTLYDATINSSAGTAMTVANGINIDPTIRNGIVKLVALQANPTTPAHWYCASVRSSGSFTLVAPAGTDFTNYTISWMRQDKFVTLAFLRKTATVTATYSQVNYTTTKLPVYLRPAAQQVGQMGIHNGGLNNMLTTSGRLNVDIDGTVQVYKDSNYAASNWTGSAVGGWDHVTISFLST